MKIQENGWLRSKVLGNNPINLHNTENIERDHYKCGSGTHSFLIKFSAVSGDSYIWSFTDKRQRELAFTEIERSLPGTVIDTKYEGECNGNFRREENRRELVEAINSISLGECSSYKVGKMIGTTIHNWVWRQGDMRLAEGIADGIEGILPL